MTGFRVKKYFLISIITAMIAMPASSPAWAIDKIDSPDVEKGELDLEYSGYRTFDNAADKNNLQDTEALIAYAPTDRWEIDAGGYFSREPNQSFRADGVLLENFFQFFEKGSQWVDSGVMIALNDSTHADLAKSIETKLLLEKDVGKFINIANLGLEQEVSAHAGGGPDRTFQWNTQYAFRDDFSVGVEVQSDFGQPNEGLDFSKEQQYIGPAVYGNVLDHFHYELAYLAGVSDASSDSAIRFLFQYQLHL
jgi:hypothetical protein